MTSAYRRCDGLVNFRLLCLIVWEPCFWAGTALESWTHDRGASLMATVVRLHLDVLES